MKASSESWAFYCSYNTAAYEKMQVIKIKVSLSFYIQISSFMPEIETSFLVLFKTTGVPFDLVTIQVEEIFQPLPSSFTIEAIEAPEQKCFLPCR